MCLTPFAGTLTSFANDNRVFPAIKSGALGYLLKDATHDQLSDPRCGAGPRLIAPGDCAESHA